MGSQNETHNLNTDAVKAAYRSREEQVRAEITKDEAIRLIEETYHTQYDPDGGLGGCLDAWGQLLACEALAEAAPIRDNLLEEKGRTNESVSDSGSVNDTYKHRADFELTPNKLRVIEKLKTCGYRTPPPKTAALLEEFFHEYYSKPTHWLYIAQHYTPRVIFWNLGYMIKAHTSGRRTFLNWAAYFTETIKLRKKRKSL